jgi:hypothetical protein
MVVALLKTARTTTRHIELRVKLQHRAFCVPIASRQLWPFVLMRFFGQRTGTYPDSNSGHAFARKRSSLRPAKGNSVRRCQGASSLQGIDACTVENDQAGFSGVRLQVRTTSPGPGCSRVLRKKCRASSCCGLNPQLGIAWQLCDKQRHDGLHARLENLQFGCSHQRVASLLSEPSRGRV